MTQERPARVREQRARAAAAVVVPDFPEIVNRAPQCRLCALADTDAETLHRIHELWRSGKGVRALETETALWWAERKVAPVNERTFDRHFKKHVDFTSPDVEFDAIAERPKADSPEGVLPPAPAPKVELAEPRPEDEEAGAVDYFDMENVIRRLRARLQQIDKDTSFVDGDGRVNTYGIVIWLKLISEMRQALESYNRMKNSDRLTRAILQAHTKRLTQMLSAPLITRFEMMLRYIQNNDVSGAAVELEKLTTGDMRAIVLRAADDAVKESVEVYKLH